MILKVLPPTLKEVLCMKTRATLFASLQFSAFSQEAFEAMLAKRITAIAYELLADEGGAWMGFECDFGD